MATDPVPRKPRKIITAEQFEAVYEALPNSDTQLLVETAIETGLRWGEVTELRVKDIDFSAGLVTVSRAVIPGFLQAAPRGTPILRQELSEGPRMAPVGGECADRAQASGARGRV